MLTVIITVLNSEIHHKVFILVYLQFKSESGFDITWYGFNPIPPKGMKNWWFTRDLNPGPLALRHRDPPPCVAAGQQIRVHL